MQQTRQLFISILIKQTTTQKQDSLTLLYVVAEFGHVLHRVEEIELAILSVLREQLLQTGVFVAQVDVFNLF